MKRVTAICATGEGATRALKALVEASFASGDITVLRVAGRQVDEPPIAHRTRIPTTLPIGIATGATIGTALFISGALPGAGMAAAGTIVGALEGLALGSAAGSLLGVLAGLGWRKLDAHAPLEELERGRLMVGVFVPDERVDHAIAALKRAHTDRVIVS